MVWPFKKNKPTPSGRKRKFSGLSQNKFGTSKSKKVADEEMEAPIEGMEDIEEDSFDDLDDVPIEGMDMPMDMDDDFDSEDDFGGVPEMKIPLDDDDDDMELDGEVDEINLDDELDKDEDEVIPSSGGMGTMRMAKQANLAPPAGMVQRPGSGGIPTASGPQKVSLNQDQVNLGRALVAGGTITKEELLSELTGAGKKDGVLGKVLLNTGYAEEMKVFASILARYRIPRLNIQNTKIPNSTLDLINSEFAKKYRVIPIEKIGNIICVAMDNIHNVEGISELRNATGCKVCVLQCAPEGMEFTLKRYYSEPRGPQVMGVAPAAPAAAAPTVAAGGAPAAAPAGSAATPITIAGLPLNAQQSQGAVPMQGRNLDIFCYWHHIHYSGKPIVPEEAIL